MIAYPRDEWWPCADCGRPKQPGAECESCHYMRPEGHSGVRCGNCYSELGPDGLCPQPRCRPAIHPTRVWQRIPRPSLTGE